MWAEIDETLELLAAANDIAGCRAWVPDPEEQRPYYVEDGVVKPEVRNHLFAQTLLEDAYRREDMTLLDAFADMPITMDYTPDGNAYKIPTTLGAMYANTDGYWGVYNDHLVGDWREIKERSEIQSFGAVRPHIRAALDNDCFRYRDAIFAKIAAWLKRNAEATGQLDAFYAALEWGMYCAYCWDDEKKIPEALLDLVLATGAPLKDSRQRCFGHGNGPTLRPMLVARGITTTDPTFDKTYYYIKTEADFAAEKAAE